MSLKFDRPIGAASDLKELEYISALHQTDAQEIRQDCSIRDIDIVRFLSSRYGISVTEEQVQTTVLRGLGGGDEDCIDLMEMVAVLFIPTLLKATSRNDMLKSVAKEDFVHPPENLLEQVTNMILHDITGDAEPKLLTEDLLKLMFTLYDERDLASNEALIKEMILAATNGEEGATFCVETLARGLTSDVKLYNFHNESKTSTNFDDVFTSGDEGVPLIEHTLLEREDMTEPTVDSKEFDLEQAQPAPVEKEGLNRLVTLSAIDFVAQTYKSKGLVICLWATFIMSYFTYYWQFRFHYEKCPSYEARTTIGSNADAFACTVISSVVVWLLRFLSLSVYGLLFMGIGSMGNGVSAKKPSRSLIGLIAVGCFTYLPLLIPPEQRTGGDGIGGSFLSATSFALGTMTMIIHLFHLIGLAIPSIQDLKFFPYPSNVRAEAQLKKATAEKVSLMGANALNVVQHFDDENVVDSFFGQALINFAKTEEDCTRAGGFRWTYKKIYSKDLAEKEGISFSGRFLASNFTQFIVAAIILVFGVLITSRINQEYDYQTLIESGNATYFFSLFNTWVGPEVTEQFLDAVDQRSAELIASAVSNSGGSLLPSDNVTSLLEDLNLTVDAALGRDQNTAELAMVIANAVADSVNSLYPEETYMLTWPFIVGTIIATVTAMATALVYAPSVASTIIKLRSGLIPSLRDQRFLRHRLKVQHITVLSGSMFWGVLFSSLLFGGLFGILLFFCLWQVTRHLALGFIAIVVGIVVTISVRQIFLILYRRNYWRGFYRTRPAPSNIAVVVTECTNFALTVAFVFVRMLRLVGGAALYVGRLDTNFLAPGVGKLGNLDLDAYPSLFLTDVIVQEAHRHPYIELLGTMYLMKLRHGERFGNRAGSCWRLLFVTALFPWLQRYRILLQTGDDVDDPTSFDLHRYSSRASIYYGVHDDEEDDESLAVIRLTTDSDGNTMQETVFFPPSPLRYRQTSIIPLTSSRNLSGRIQRKSSYGGRQYQSRQAPSNNAAPSDHDVTDHRFSPYVGRALDTINESEVEPRTSLNRRLPEMTEPNHNDCLPSHPQAAHQEETHFDESKVKQPTSRNRYLPEMTEPDAIDFLPSHPQTRHHETTHDGNDHFPPLTADIGCPSLTPPVLRRSGNRHQL